MNKKLIAVLGATAVTGVVTVSAYAVNNQGGISLNEYNTDSYLSTEYNATTSSAIDYNVTTSNIEMDKNESSEVKSLSAEIIGNATIGSTLSVNVKGFNELNQEVELDKSKLKYSWVTEDNEILGNESELKIDENMDGAEVHCNVSYVQG